MNITLPAPLAANPSASMAAVVSADLDALIAAMQPGHYPLADLHAAYAAAVQEDGRTPASRVALGCALGRDPRVANSRTARARMWHLV